MFCTELTQEAEVLSLTPAAIRIQHDQGTDWRARLQTIQSPRPIKEEESEAVGLDRSTVLCT